MRISSINTNYNQSESKDVVIVESNLKAIAMRYNTTVADLLDKAGSLDEPTGDMKRALNLKERLDSLKGDK